MAAVNGSLFVDGREGSPVEPEPTWYDEDGHVIVTNDDRWHGYASQFREMVESLSEWNDPAVWQYKLDLLREAIDHERPYAERALRQMREDTADPNDAIQHPVEGCGRNV